MSGKQWEAGWLPGVAGLLLAVAASSCSEPSSAPTVTVSDSVGVTVVTNGPESLEAIPEWSLSSEPVTRIGAGTNPDVALFRVTSVVPLGGGRVVVGTNNPPQARVFGPDGGLVATLGGPGEGPGEFHTTASVVPLGDSLAVWDDSRRRLAVFDENASLARDVGLGEVARITPFAAPSTQTLAAWTRLLPTASGQIVLFQEGVWDPSAPQGVHRAVAPTLLISPEGTPTATLGSFPGAELHDGNPYPFGANTWAGTSGDDLVVGTARDAEYRVHDASGVLRRIVRWPAGDREVAGPRLDEFTEWFEAQLAELSPEDGRFIRDLVERMPRPALSPAYQGLLVSSDRRVWVGAYPGQLGLFGLSSEVRPMPSRRWLIFEPDGTLTASLETPAGFVPYAIHEGHMWGVHHDELGIESVVGWRIEMPAGSGS